jgi:hypothetical protein
MRVTLGFACFSVQMLDRNHCVSGTSRDLPVQSVPFRGFLGVSVPKFLKHLFQCQLQEQNTVNDLSCLLLRDLCTFDFPPLCLYSRKHCQLKLFVQEGREGTFWQSSDFSSHQFLCNKCLALYYETAYFSFTSLSLFFILQTDY